MAHRDVVKLVHSYQAIVELLHAVCVYREAERRMGADEHLIRAPKKCANGVDLPPVVPAWGVAQVPFWLHAPVGPKAELLQRLIVEARADGFFRHNDDRLLEALMLELVQCDKHEGAALTGCGRRLDEQELLTALLVGAFLHGPHAERVRLGGATVARVGDGDGRD